jgi:hypothetical protein
MDFSLFYHDGEALHQGGPNVQSHGCIHVPAPYAEQLFNWAASNKTANNQDRQSVFIAGYSIRCLRPKVFFVLGGRLEEPTGEKDQTAPAFAHMRFMVSLPTEPRPRKRGVLHEIPQSADHL